ncbi:recombinase family protein [Gandjariella thermophila]|uniref:Recombinase domain-containing protein n=1 Tax=Gandjariella thermophila TaxID=1931992 RepID=A0A4D4J8T4_9PSEU|nr:hypothetical protein GTS_48680 [Gandjariella thermophila]
MRIWSGTGSHPDEAPIIRELFERLRQGHSLRTIQRDFAARGIQNRSGRPFSSQHLRGLACNAAYAGLRVHYATPTVGPRRRPTGITNEADVTKAVWPGLVEPETFYAVQRRLVSPASGSPKQNWTPTPRKP